MGTAMAKRQALPLGSIPEVPEDQMVTVLLPAGWMRAIGEKLDRLLRATADGEGSATAKTADPSGEKYLSRKDAAEITGYDERTLQRHIDAGSLKACGLRRDRIAPPELHRWMTEMAKRRRPPSPANQTTPADGDDVDAIVDRLINDAK